MQVRSARLNDAVVVNAILLGAEYGHERCPTKWRFSVDIPVHQVDDAREEVDEGNRIGDPQSGLGNSGPVDHQGDPGRCVVRMQPVLKVTDLRAQNPNDFDRGQVAAERPDQGRVRGAVWVRPRSPCPSPILPVTE